MLKKNFQIKYLNWIISLPTFVGFIFLVFSCKNNDSPNAQFEVSIETTQVGDSISFTNKSSGSDYYQWSFGDGAYAITKDTKHAYSKAGIYTAKMVAIGNDKSSSTSQQITITGEIKIFEGKGISEFNVNDTWSSIDGKFSNEDTSYYSENDEPYYYHYVDYYNLGIAALFVNFSEADIDPNDEAYVVYVYQPYEGYTSKGIKIGSEIEDVKTAYGTPEIYNGSNYKVYYYDETGIEFFVSNSSTKVGEIAVYEASGKKSGSYTSEKYRKVFRSRFMKK